MASPDVLGWGFKFLLTLPLVWAFIIGLLDYSKDINFLFFSRTLKRIFENEERIRDECSNQLENCPIYDSLLRYKSSSHTDYAKKVGTIPTIKILNGEVAESENPCVIWSLMRGMCINYQQAAFFEIIVIQFFIAFLMLDSGVKMMSLIPGFEFYIKYFYLVVSILFFIVPWLIQTFIYQENSSSYTRIKYRLALVSLTWIVLMGL